MPNYRRNRVPGGTYFFTVTLRDRRADFLTRHIEILRAAMRRERLRRPFHIDAWVVLPEHMHRIWTLPEGDVDYPIRWQGIKYGFTMALAAMEHRNGSVWQPRYWEDTIRDTRDYAAHMDYVHFNPVKHGYVAHPADWPWSSFRACVTRGLYSAQWTGEDATPDQDMGERS